MTSEFNRKHPRSSIGQFTEKAQADPGSDVVSGSNMSTATATGVQAAIVAALSASPLGGTGTKPADIERAARQLAAVPVDRERFIDILVMSPLSDHAGTDLAPFEQAADQIVATLEHVRTADRTSIANLLDETQGVDVISDNTSTRIAAILPTLVDECRGDDTTADLVDKYDQWEQQSQAAGVEFDPADRDVVMLWAFATRLGIAPAERPIADRFGDQYAARYSQLEDWQQAQVDKALKHLERCSDAEFADRCEEAIGADAIMSGSRNNQHYFLITDAMFAESDRRHQAAGHTASCRGTTLYDRAHNRAARSNGYTPTPDQPCTCGHDSH